MSAELIKVENDVAEVVIEVDGESFKEALDQAYLENRSHFNVPGFRKGKAPRRIIEVNYGKDIFYEEAVHLALNKLYGPMLDELELDAIDYPEMEVDGEVGEDGFKVNFKIPLRPEAVLGDYKGAKVEYEEVEVGEELVDAALENEREKNARLVNVDGAAEEGDTVNIDFEGFLDGETFEGGKAAGHDLELGSNSFIPGFEEQLVGKSEGDEVDVEVTFPEDYHSEDFAGKDATFKVVVNSIKRRELPELDDDFAMDVSEYDTLDEYKESLKKELEEQSEEVERDAKVGGAMEVLIDGMEVEIPDVLVEDELENEFRGLANQLAQYGMDMDMFLSSQDRTEEDMREEMRPTALHRVQEQLALTAFAKAEGIEVSEEEIDEELTELAESMESENVETFIEDWKKNQGTESAEMAVRNRKIVDRILEVFEFTPVEAKDEDSEESE